MNNYLKHFSVAFLITALVCIFLSSCSKEKQRKTYEFEGRLHSMTSGNRSVSGKLRMDGTGYGEISFDGVPAISVRAVSTPKDNYINFLPESKYNRGGYIKKSGEVYFTNDIHSFQGKLK
jgi:hypothetical protein